MLVAEDDPALARVIAAALRDVEELLVTVVHDGAAALDLLLHEHVDLVIADVGLPELRGDELLPVLRELGARVPRLVLISARAADELADLAAEDAVAWLEKPFSERALVVLVEELLSRPTLAPAAT